MAAIHSGPLVTELAVQMKLHGISDRALADQVGVSHGAPYFWRRGVYRPHAPTARRIGRHFGLSPDVLFGPPVAGEEKGGTDAR